jgi:hypothetical protein
MFAIYNYFNRNNKMIPNNLLSLLIIFGTVFNLYAKNWIEKNPTNEFNLTNNIGIRIINYEINKDTINNILKIVGQIEIKNNSENGIYGHGFYRVMLKDSSGKIVQMARSEDEEDMIMKPYIVEPGKTKIQSFDGYLHSNNFYFEFAIKWDGNELFKCDKTIITRWIKIY